VSSRQRAITSGAHTVPSEGGATRLAGARVLASLVVPSTKIALWPKRLGAPPLAPACELAEPGGPLGTGPGARRTTGPDSLPGGASGEVRWAPGRGCPRRAFCGCGATVWLLGTPGPDGQYPAVVLHDGDHPRMHENPVL
jgi:hypothetical protein